MQAKRLTKILTLSQLRDYIGCSAVTRKFAEQHNLVYFGSVGRNDESRLVRGLTISNTHRDLHYLVGSDLGRDVIFLQRTDRIRSANRKKSERYTWNILAFDLRDDIHMPRIYVEGRSRHGLGFYETLAMKAREMGEIPASFLSNYDPLFAKRYAVRLSAASAVQFPHIVTPERAAVMAHHFSAFDFEMFDDMLYVYFLSRRPSFAQLETMFSAGVWLANELEGRAADGREALVQNTPA